MREGAFVSTNIEGIVVIKKNNKQGAEPAKVTKSLEEALDQVKIEWIEE